MRKLLLMLMLCVSSLIGNDSKFISMVVKSNNLSKQELKSQKWQIYLNDVFLKESLEYLENPNKSVVFKNKKGKVKVPNYKEALKLLEKSIDYNNPFAASIYLFVLKTYTTPSFSKKKILYINKAVNILLNQKLCDGYMYYEMISKNKQDLIKRLKEGLEICKKNNKKILDLKLAKLGKGK